MATIQLDTVDTLIILTHAGVCSDSIEVQGNENGPICAMANNWQSWKTLHNLSKVKTVFVRHTEWNGDYVDTPWLESAPYIHRKRRLK